MYFFLTKIIQIQHGTTTHFVIMDKKRLGVFFLIHWQIMLHNVFLFFTVKLKWSYMYASITLKDSAIFFTGQSVKIDFIVSDMRSYIIEFLFLVW